MANVRRNVGDGAWVEFKASGYPFSLRRKLRDANDDEALIEIIIPFISECNLTNLDGETLTKISSKEDLLNVDELTVTDIIWKFYDFRAERNREPLSKNT